LQRIVATHADVPLTAFLVGNVVHKNATHAWDRAGNLTKKGLKGQDVAYRYNPKVTADSVKLAFDFLDSHVKGMDRQQ